MLGKLVYRTFETVMEFYYIRQNHGEEENVEQEDILFKALQFFKNISNHT